MPALAIDNETYKMLTSTDYDHHDMWIPSDEAADAMIDWEADFDAYLREVSDARWARELELQIEELYASAPDDVLIDELFEREAELREHGPADVGTCEIMDPSAYGQYGTLSVDLPSITRNLMRARKSLRACIDLLAAVGGYEDGEAYLRGRKFGDTHYQLRDALSCVDHGIERIQYVAAKVDAGMLPAGPSFFSLSYDAAAELRVKTITPTRRGVARAIERLELADASVASQSMDATADLRSAREYLNEACPLLRNIEEFMQGERRVLHPVAA